MFSITRLLNYEKDIRRKRKAICLLNSPIIRIKYLPLPLECEKKHLIAENGFCYSTRNKQKKRQQQQFFFLRRELSSWECRSGKKQIKGWIRARVVKKLSGFRKKRKREMEIWKTLKRKCWRKFCSFLFCTIFLSVNFHFGVFLSVRLIFMTSDCFPPSLVMQLIWFTPHPPIYLHGI